MNSYVKFSEMITVGTKKFEISLSQYLFLYHDVPKHLYLKKVSEGRSVGSLDSRVQSMPLYYNVMTQQKD